MRLKQRITCEEFHNDATNAPNIARKAPAQLKDDLWRAVVSGRDNGRMVLVIECGRSEVNEADFTVKQYSPLTSSPRGDVRRRGNIPVVGKCLKCSIYQKNVLRLQVGMDEIKIMKNCKCDQQNDSTLEK